MSLGDDDWPVVVWYALWVWRSEMMDLVRVECGGCGAKLKFKRPKTANAIRCPRCQNKVAVPAAGSQIPAAMAQEPRARKTRTSAASPVAAEVSGRKKQGQPSSPVNRAKKAPASTVRGSKFGFLPIACLVIACIGGSVAGTLWYLGPPDEPEFGGTAMGGNDAAATVSESRGVSATRNVASVAPAQTPRIPAPTVIASQRKPGPIYRLEVGDQHTYRISITAGDRYPRKTTASCVYQVMNGTADNWQDSEASGTGFVVSANGYVATCAHVVARASNIDVLINGTNYAATVVAQNTDTDLALLRIDATDLVACALGDSEDVQLAETVRAFGYPLSTVLGTDLKVVTGSISGITMDRKTGRRIQTDAPINPGNSGGPLVNDRGQVVGIASSKLSSRMASSVGLASPVNDLKAMLTAANVTLPSSKRPESIAGPEIAKAVTPSMAFIKVTGVNGKVFDLNFRAENRLESMFPQLVGHPMFAAPNWDGEMKLSEFGEVVEQSGDPGGLPYVLGAANQFCLPPIDYLGRDSWTSERQMMLQLAAKGPTDLFSALFQHSQRNSPFGSRTRQEPPRIVPAEEIVTYTTAPIEGTKNFTITKTYRLATLDSEENPELLAEGEGTITFDSALGLPSKGIYTGKVTQGGDGSRREITPVKASFRHYSDDDLRKEREAMTQRRVTQSTKPSTKPSTNASLPATESSPAPSEKVSVFTEPAKPGSKSTTTTTTTITTTPSGTIRKLEIKRTNPEGVIPFTAGQSLVSTLSRLKSVPETQKSGLFNSIVFEKRNEEKRGEVLKAVTPYLDSDDEALKTAATVVFAYYGDKSDLDKLKALADESSGYSLRIRMHAEARITQLSGGTINYDELVRALKVLESVRPATELLSQGGKAAETAILKQLESFEKSTTMDAVFYLLTQLGGTQTIEALKKSKHQRDPRMIGVLMQLQMKAMMPSM